MPVLSSRSLINNEYILVTGIYFFIHLGHIPLLKGNLVCKEMKSIVETVSKDASSFKTIVTAKPHHLKN